MRQCDSVFKLKKEKKNTLIFKIKSYAKSLFIEGLQLLLLPSGCHYWFMSSFGPFVLCLLLIFLAIIIIISLLKL